jgi:hypothetical protein
MERLTLSFPSVFDLYDFKKDVEPTHTEARVNHLTGHFTTTQLEIATTVYKAKVIKEAKEQ